MQVDREFGQIKIHLLDDFEKQILMADYLTIDQKDFLNQSWYLPLYEGIDLLERIGRGETSLRLDDPQKNWAEIYAGNVNYISGDGYKIAVFNDCDSFDYVDSIISPGGRRIGEYQLWQAEDPFDETADNSIDMIIYRRNSEFWNLMTDIFINAK